MRKNRSLERSLQMFGNNLRTARIRRRITQKDAATRAGMDVKTLRRIERGDPHVSIGKVAFLIFFLGLGTPLKTLAEPDAYLLDIRETPLPKRARRF